MRVQPIDTVHLNSATHGAYECKGRALDLIIDEYGHLTILGLQSVIEGWQGLEPGSYPLNSRTEGFMIIAELTGYATN